MTSLIKKAGVFAGAVILIMLSLIGWGVLFVQKPDILLRARWRYLQVVYHKTKLDDGPCLGKIANDWVLDVAHLPRIPQDDLPENQCQEYLSGQVHHFVEMSPKGEIIVVK